MTDASGPSQPAASLSARELAVLVVNGLNLEDVDPQKVDLAAPLFGGGLDLDSLDLLEVSLLIQQHCGVKLKADDPENEAIFGSLQSLADHIGRTLAARH
jgi:acyl carrier protein